MEEDTKKMDERELNEEETRDTGLAVDNEVEASGNEQADTDGSDNGGATTEEETLPRPEFDGADVDFADALEERARSYGSYVITSRALPDIRDGLKPVQRRILYAMHSTGNRADKSYRKSAKTVGAVIGDFHPHGDSAVYDAMVNLAQSFRMQVPLIDGQGNWGTPDGDPAAAQRYTEARLSRASDHCMADLNDAIVPFRPTFDGTKTEPTVLPVTLPLLLINGSQGIAWSMACSIPPHNPGEVLDAALYLAEHPEATLEQLMRRMPAPDFPGGGVLANYDGLKEIYATGRGTCRLQGRFTIEPRPGNTQAIVIRELPHLVGPDQLVEKIVAAARAEKIQDVTELPRNLSDRTGTRVEIKCKRGGNIQRLIADLLQHTPLEQTVAFNFTVLIDGRPRTVGLQEMLQAFLDHRHTVIRGRLELERHQLERRLHRLHALLAALDIIDQVVKIIRSSRDDNATREALMAKLRYTPHGQKRKQAIDAEQAQWVMDMPLKRLNQLNKLELEEEARACGERIDEITAILNSPDGVTQIVTAELKEARRTYGCERRTVLAEVSGAGAVTEGAASTTGGARVADAPAEDIWVAAASDGSIAALRSPKRTPKAALKLSGEARMVGWVATRSDRPLLAFTAQGRCFRLSVLGMVEEKVGRGQKLVALDRDDELVAVLAEGEETHYLLATAQGQVKRIAREVLTSANPGGIVAYGVPAGDRIIGCVAHTDADEICLATAQGQLLRFVAAKLRPVQTGGAGGVAGISLRDNDRVESAFAARGSGVLTLHETGHGKSVPLGDYPTKGRNGGGVANSDPTKPTRHPAGLVAAVFAYTENGSDGVLRIFTSHGSVIEIALAELDTTTRAGVARALLTLGPGELPAGMLVRA